MSRQLLHGLAALATAVVLTPGPRCQAQATVSGIRYAIEPTPDTEPFPNTAYLTARIGGVVEFAAGRGRLDVAQNLARLVIRIDSVVLAPPLAHPGDYYLFDSTGFILVRPHSKTFSRFVFSVDEYNYQNASVGWPPGGFRQRPLHPDTLPLPASAESPSLRALPIYWHMELYQAHREHQAIHVLARGHEVVDRMPAGEYSIVRWFGPTQALAHLPGGVDHLPADSALRITAVAIDLGGQHQIVGLTATAIDLSRLVLPRGYTETRAAPAFGSDSGAARPAPGARWMVPPSVDRTGGA